MDPAAFLLLLATLSSPTAGKAANALASTLLNQARLVPAYVTVQGGGMGANPTRARVIRQGKVITVRFKDIRAHPELDLKLQPGDIIDLESFF